MISKWGWIPLALTCFLLLSAIGTVAVDLEAARKDAPGRFTTLSKQLKVV